MLTPAGRITKGLTDRRSALAVPLNSPRSRQTELTNHRSGGLGAGEPGAMIRRARQLSYLALCGGRIGRPSGACRLGAGHMLVGAATRRGEMLGVTHRSARHQPDGRMTTARLVVDREAPSQAALCPKVCNQS
jgi:hypothetical protein